MTAIPYAVGENRMAPSADAIQLDFIELDAVQDRATSAKWPENGKIAIAQNSSNRVFGILRWWLFQICLWARF